VVDPQTLEAKISELLDDFYTKRTQMVTKLDLLKVLKRKNPYLYRALGVGTAAEIVDGILAAYVASSDETLFGSVFFEPLAKFVSGGVVAPSEGVDVAIETETAYQAIAVKSGTSVFNADSRKRQEQNFRALEKRLQKLQKHFDPIVGYCYGKKRQKSDTQTAFRELAGQAFWQALTGDPDFYLRIIELMQEKPQEHQLQYKVAYDAALNRFVRQFIETFCDEDGAIDWAKLTRFNSGADG